MHMESPAESLICAQEVLSYDDIAREVKCGFLS